MEVRFLCPIVYFATAMTAPEVIPAKVFRQVPLPSKKGRRLVVPDIHGCAATFNALLEQVEFGPADQLFILGDLINRGPDSLAVLDLVLGLLDMGLQVYPLRGNHEEMLMVAESRGPEALTALVAAQPAMGGLINKKGRVRKRFRKWLPQWPLYMITEGFLLVHAGLNMQITDPLRDLKAMTWVRDFRLDAPFRNLRVLHGHTPRPLAAIMADVQAKAPSVGLDNGCALHGRDRQLGHLLCLDLDSNHLYQQRYIG